jgi:hypothetical protein
VGYSSHLIEKDDYRQDGIFLECNRAQETPNERREVEDDKWRDVQISSTKSTQTSLLKSNFRT